MNRAAPDAQRKALAVVAAAALHPQPSLNARQQIGRGTLREASPRERDRGSKRSELGCERWIRCERLVESQQAEAHLRAAYDELDDEQRLLLSLRDLENMSYEEIRLVTELPIGTVKSKLHRARMALHERFAALQRGPERAR